MALDGEGNGLMLVARCLRRFIIYIAMPAIKATAATATGTATAIATVVSSALSSVPPV